MSMSTSSVGPLDAQQHDFLGIQGAYPPSFLPNYGSALVTMV